MKKNLAEVMFADAKEALRDIGVSISLEQFKFTDEACEILLIHGKKTTVVTIREVEPNVFTLEVQGVRGRQGFNYPLGRDIFKQELKRLVNQWLGNALRRSA